MKAWRVKTHGSPEEVLVLDEEVPLPEPAADQVRIRVGAAALNFGDDLLCRGRYQLRPELPFTPGLEVAGEVVAAGVQAAAAAALVAVADPVAVVGESAAVAAESAAVVGASAAVAGELVAAAAASAVAVLAVVVVVVAAAVAVAGHLDRLMPWHPFRLPASNIQAALRFTRYLSSLKLKSEAL